MDTADGEVKATLRRLGARRVLLTEGECEVRLLRLTIELISSPNSLY